MWKKQVLSYLPAKAPRLHTRGREGRHVRYSAPCTPALAWSLARPTTLSVRTRKKHTEIKAMIIHASGILLRVCGALATFSAQINNKQGCLCYEHEQK